MKHTIDTLVKFWKDSYQNDKYSDEAIENIAANCLSLSETWFDNNRPREGESFCVTLINKEGVNVNDLFGVTRENLPETMIKTLTTESDTYSKMVVKSFLGGFDGVATAKVIGELEIN